MLVHTLYHTLLLRDGIVWGCCPRIYCDGLNCGREVGFHHRDEAPEFILLICDEQSDEPGSQEDIGNVDDYEKKIIWR